MLEQTNEIARKINSLAGRTVLNECKPLLSNTTRLPSTDMSKTTGSTINLGASDKELFVTVKSMYTAPDHLKIKDLGKAEGNVIFTYLDAFHPHVIYINQLK